MSKRPVIGITVDANDAHERYLATCTYAAGVEKAGGLPLLIPYKVDHALIPQFVDLFDGILFSGGNDLDPSLYGENEWHPKAIKIDPDRQRFELALLAEVEKRRMPTLGICLGSQLLNVYRGGSLIQFLPDFHRDNAIEHRYIAENGATRHPVKMEPDCQLARAIGKTEFSVNTFHKQAIAKIGRGLRIVGTAPDGIIEAYEDPTMPLFAAVQWHPERLIDEKEHLAPFELLVNKASEASRR